MKQFSTVLATLLLAAAARGDITSNVEAHWAYDAGTGTTDVDSSGNGHNLTFFNTPTWAAGKVGDFSLTHIRTSSQYGQTATWGGIQGSGAITFACWFKSTYSGAQYIASWGDTSAAGASYRVGLEIGVVWLRCNSVTRSWGSGYADGQWHHLVITKPASGKIEDTKCYVDAVLLTPASTTGTGFAVSPGSGNPVYLGYDWAGSGFWDGNLDDAWTFSRELSASDVLELFLLGKATISDPIAWWKLDETSGTTAADATGNGHHGTYTNSPTLNQAGAFGTSKAVLFANASSQYVLCDDSAAYPVGNTGLTVSLWIKVTSTIASQVVVGKWGTAGGREWEIYLDSISRPRFTASSNGTATSEVVWASGLTLGQWYLIIGRHDPTADTISISVDAATPVTTTAFTGGLYDSTSPVRIGFAPAAPYLNATVDDVRIYNTAKDAREVYAIYQYTGASAITVPLSRLINLGINPAKQSRAALVNH